MYGLPELYGNELAGAKLVANPGCYPTSVILGLRPLIDAGWIDRGRGIVCDCKSGATGAGKEPKKRNAIRRGGREFPRLWACSRTGTRRK